MFLAQAATAQNVVGGNKNDRKGETLRERLGQKTKKCHSQSIRSNNGYSTCHLILHAPLSCEYLSRVPFWRNNDRKCTPRDRWNLNCTVIICTQVHWLHNSFRRVATPLTYLSIMYFSNSFGCSKLICSKILGLKILQTKSQYLHFVDSLKWKKKIYLLHLVRKAW